jgi:type I restriction enzyme S subunit
MAGETRSFGELFAEPPRNGLNRPKAIRGAGTKMVNMGELFAHPRIRNAPMDRVPLSTSEAERFTLREGDLLFARQSLVLEGAGKCSIFLGDNEPVTFESHVTRVRLDRAKADPNFFYYYLHSHHGRAAIRSIVEQGAGASGIRGSDLASLGVLWHPLSEQRAIAHILGTLDDKIELNQRMNETLEAIARTLFKSWFVDFDPVRAKADGRDPRLPEPLAALFPNRLVDSELGEIPEGWPIESLGDHYTAVRGVSYKGSGLGDDGTPLHNLNSVYEGGGYKYEGIKYYSGEYAERHILLPGDAIVANTEQGHDRLLIGYAALVPALFGTPGIASHHIYRLRPRSGSPLTAAFLCWLLNSPQMHEVVSGYANGTTVNMLPIDGLQKPLVARPPTALVSLFDSLAVTVERRREEMISESRTLATLRDTLLPTLVSGQLRV